MRSGILAALRKQQPDAVVVLHFLVIDPIIASLKSLALDIPVFVLVTDPFTAHPLWFLHKNLIFIVGSDRLKQRCLDMGISGEHLHVFSSIVDARFSLPVEPGTMPKLREAVGITHDRPLVLLLGGGDGLPRGKRILQAIVDADLPVGVAIVCGRNGRLESAARKIAAVSTIPVAVWGYTDKVFELIHASSVVVSKGGASAIMEILLCGKMPIVTDYLWEQEKGNVEFLTDNGVGLYENSVARIPKLLDRFLVDSPWQERVRKRIEELSLKNGTESIGNFIIQNIHGA
jgi:processive 1,2-diacylglycerol beta-glucosyltransferase/1,2-diacylglycerol 3-beta-galactosyltransferase